jgi:aspartate 1-decarboxylase
VECHQRPVIIAAFCMTDEEMTPQMIAVDERNRFVRFLELEKDVEENAH